MSVLESVLADVRAELAHREQRVSLEDMKRRALQAPSPRDALGALKGPGAVTIMAEIKRRNLRDGYIAPIPDPGALARQYVDGGATMVACVTENRHFDGSLADLQAVRRAIDLPILRKDYIISPYQIHESRAYGADMVLLFAALLDQPHLRGFIERIESLGMSALVEVDSRVEAVRALDAGAKAIGVNARNLHNLKIDRSNFDEIVDVIPSNVIAVAQSGVRDPRDVFVYARAGADSVLVGKSLVSASDPRALVAEMVSAAQHPALLADRKKRIQQGIHERQVELYQAH
ncbi:indole-3-glycerol phosphate synthase TrpC [uncultured Actinomyces sp.]|uniref:indole-3-glycerol phosphate synthase TrpC n=1 Tax=uncultured Actinomyces sp. TaxID=249061 RepID=UPI0026348162|nr:indole-3-glycerol phosphate synthase TrpC [uncultured Actinomyces sp.]